MSQQLGVVLMVDVDAALQNNTLEGHTYMFDNMKLQGSEGLGTGKLISALHGSHWMNGSQANEQVLNWVAYGIGSLPPSLPKTFSIQRAKKSDMESMGEFKTAISNIEQEGEARFAGYASTLQRLKKISLNAGVTVHAKKSDHMHQKYKFMDVMGQFVDPSDSNAKVSYIPPIITKITGEAVDKGIMYPAAYGSPDLFSDGWYWSASVSTFQLGIYAYTMHVQLSRLVQENKEWIWEPVTMTCDAYINISNDPKVNGFTGNGIGLLPVV